MAAGLICGTQSHSLREILCVNPSRTGYFVLAVISYSPPVAGIPSASPVFYPEQLIVISQEILELIKGNPIFREKLSTERIEIK
jgi:hypothetical protein